ncbi:MAG TPA: hypothetical protein VKH42_07160 [Vicinamibacterales bacterium]|nr:hypothetical protein [Vicinamibacterales bacterium]
MRSRALFPAAVVALVAALASLAAPRMLGDSGDYVVTALNLVEGKAPSLSPEDLQRAAERYPGDVSRHLVIPEYRGVDGRQDLPHFWFYPLLAAPFVRVAVGLGGDPIRGFAMLNVVLLAAAAFVLSARHSKAATAIVVLGPILWWVDKAQTEVFTFSLLTIAVAVLRDAPWWSAVALGVASTQNPPLAAAALLAIAYGLFAFGWRDPRLWRGAAAGCGFAALHPFYSHLRLGVWSALRVGIDPHWPGLREILTTPFDPNVGIFVYDWPLTIAVLAAAALALSDPRTSPKRMLYDGRAVVLIVAALFLISFTQTTNVNSGGTPGPSRYGLWLVPLTVPILATVADGASWLNAIAAVSLVWCAVLFAPQRAEKYVSPSRLAAAIWERWPALDNPVAEIFAERAGGREPAVDPVIVAHACRKALIEGNGSDSVALTQCDGSPVLAIPPECRSAGTYCYANLSGGSWDFVRAPATPYWRTIMARRSETAPEHHATPVAAYTLPPDRPPAPIAWLGSGWSYVERTEASTTQPATAWRWMADRAELRLLSAASVDVTLRIVARAFGKTRRLRISVGGASIAEITIIEPPQEYETPRFTIPSGTAVMEFESLDGSDRAPGGTERRLAIAIFDVEIVSVDPSAAPK